MSFSIRNLINIVAATTIAMLSGEAFATERSHSGVVKFVYPTGSGVFAVGFNTDSPYCINGSSPHKYYYVSVGQNGVNADGHKMMYSALMMAMASGLTVQFAFEDSTANCYINRLNVTT